MGWKMSAPISKEQALAIVLGGPDMRGPADIETGDQIVRLFKVLQQILHHRHFEQKQRWIELHWDYLLHVAQRIDLYYYPWPCIPPGVKRHLKNQLLSQGYGVATPPYPHDQEGIIIQWRPERFNK